MTDKEKIIRMLCDTLDGCPLLYPCDKLFSPDGWCKDHCKPGQDAPDAECWLKYAEVMTSEALRTKDVPDTNVGDLISRREAIELANSLKDDLPDDERIADTVMAHNEGILEYQTKLSLLPSAQPEPQWIPVSERLPDVDEDGYSDLVLVSFSNFSVPAILEYRKGDDDWYEQTEADGEPGVSGIGLVVNAWKPLPIPYRPLKN